MNSELAPATVDPVKMKAFWVGDNRASTNWGRGASIALYEILSTEYDISGIVTGDFFDLMLAEAGYVHTLMPSRHYKYFRSLLKRKRQRIVAWYLRLERLWGAHDFISESPERSVDSLIAEKHRYPALNRLYEDAANADFFVVDGDGDIVFATPPRRTTLSILAMIELGLRLGKPVFLVNTMISDCPITGRNESTFQNARRLTARCTGVTLRDKESLRLVREEMPEARSSFIPDSLFSWFYRYQERGGQLRADGRSLLPHPEKEEYFEKPDLSRPYICIGGGALASWYPDRAVESYGRLVDAVSELGFRVYLMECDEPDFFLRKVADEKHVGIVLANAPILLSGEVLANARLFISGRYHPSILASLGGTPCIFLGSHAHKMGSLAEVLEYDAPREFDAFPDDDEIRNIVALAHSYLEQGEELRINIRQVAKTRADQVRCLTDYLNEHLHQSSRPVASIGLQ